MSSPRRFRKVATVERAVGAEILVVLPETSETRLLGPTASLIWTELAEPAEEAELLEMLQQTYPWIPDLERRDALAAILVSLELDGLVSIS